MTVKELIEILNNIEDKTIKVEIYFDSGEWETSNGTDDIRVDIDKESVLIINRNSR